MVYNSRVPPHVTSLLSTRFTQHDGGGQTFQRHPPAKLDAYFAQSGSRVPGDVQHAVGDMPALQPHKWPQVLTAAVNVENYNEGKGKRNRGYVAGEGGSLGQHRIAGLPRGSNQKIL